METKKIDVLLITGIGLALVASLATIIQGIHHLLSL